MRASGRKWRAAPANEGVTKSARNSAGSIQRVQGRNTSDNETGEMAGKRERRYTAWKLNQNETSAEVSQFHPEPCGLKAGQSDPGPDSAPHASFDGAKRGAV